MREMTASEVRGVQLHALDVFSDFCAERGLSFQLAYGSLLGAVRHGGYIPWDDDIDVMMPREDYARLLAVWNQDDEFVVAAPETSKSWPLPFAKLWRRDTLVKEATALPLRAGVGLDIWPVDRCPAPGSTTGVFKFTLSRLWHKLDVLASVETRPDQSRAKRTVLSAAKPMMRIVGAGRLARLRNWTAQRFAPQEGELGIFVGSYPWCVQPAILGEGSEGIFEGREVPLPEAVTATLVQLYGPSFMQPPPESERVTHHKISAFWVAIQ